MKEFATPVENTEVSETQRILRIDQILVTGVDGTPREASWHGVLMLLMEMRCSW